MSVTVISVKFLLARINQILAEYCHWFEENHGETRWSRVPFDDKRQMFQLYLLNNHADEMVFELYKHVEIARVLDHKGELELAVALDEEGASINERFTTVYFGKYMAVLLDESVISAPRIETQVVGSQMSIPGSLGGINNIQVVAACLSSGALGVEIKDVSIVE